MPPSEVLPFPQPSLVGGAGIYVTGEESIRLSGFNAATSVQLELRGRFLPSRQRSDEPEPRVMPFARPLALTSDRLVARLVEYLGEGWLLDWHVAVVSGTPKVGQTYAVVDLLRGLTTSSTLISRLGYGYVTANQPLTSFGGAWMSSVDGPGVLRSITGTDPGAGVEISEVVPANVRWALRAFSYVLVTSAVVATRVSTLTIDDGATIYHAASPQSTQTASQTARYSAGPLGFSGSSSDNKFLTAFPAPTILEAGHRIRTATLAKDAGDDYAAPQYLVEEWMVP
jgi:hypothetical protein